ncbi:MAG TPA: hypothetical protein VJC17_00635 [Candidatus Dojkabacteria bacterium]|nr:hypothetical protein [Candidatus Dojkabacteria bacterium]
MLTNSDLIKFGKLVEGLIVHNTSDLKVWISQTFASKKELNELKDLVIGIRNELDTEHVVRGNTIERHTKEISNIKRILRLSP